MNLDNSFAGVTAARAARRSPKQPYDAPVAAARRLPGDAVKNPRNFLPGLRPVVNEVEAYFGDRFVWLV